MAEEIKVYGFCENKCRRETMTKEKIEELFENVAENLTALQKSLTELNEALGEDIESLGNGLNTLQEAVNSLSESLSNKADTNHSHGALTTVTLASVEPATVADGEVVMVYEIE